MSDRPDNEDRKKTPGGDSRNQPVPCFSCKGKTMNISRKCDDCMDREQVKS